MRHWEKEIILLASNLYSSWHSLMFSTNLLNNDNVAIFIVITKVKKNSLDNQANKVEGRERRIYNLEKHKITPPEILHKLFRLPTQNVVPTWAVNRNDSYVDSMCSTVRIVRKWHHRTKFYDLFSKRLIAFHFFSLSFPCIHLAP